MKENLGVLWYYFAGALTLNASHIALLQCIRDSIDPRPWKEGMIMRGGTEQGTGRWIVLPRGVFFNSLQLRTTKGFLTLLHSAGCLSLKQFSYECVR